MRTVMPCCALLLVGCHALPELDEGKLDETGLEDTASPTLHARVTMAFSVALQRGDWGDSVTRCQVEVAFLEEGQHDGLFDSDGGSEITLPSTPGSCAYTSFADVEPALGLWTVRGTRRAEDSIWLHGDDGALELTLGTDETGRYTYSLPDCDEHSFPFAQVLDLEVPGWSGPDGLTSFSAPEAFAVGPDMAITSMSHSPDERGWVVVPAGDDISLVWSYDDALPTVDGEAVAHTPYVMLRNMHPAVEDPIEALACLPSVTGTVTISAADLAQLTPTDDPESGDPFVAFQVDAWYEGPEFQTPWRSSSRVLSVVTEGGIVVLEP